MFGQSRVPSWCNSVRGLSLQYALRITALGADSFGAATDSGCASYLSTSLHYWNDMVAAVRELPVFCCALEVDGRLRAEFAIRDGARTDGAELKTRFPMRRIRIYACRRMSARKASGRAVWSSTFSRTAPELPALRTRKWAGAQLVCQGRYRCPVRGNFLVAFVSALGPWCRLEPICLRSCVCHRVTRCAARAPDRPRAGGISTGPVKNA